MRISKRSTALAISSAVVAAAGITGASVVGSADAAPVTHTRVFNVIDKTSIKKGRLTFVDNQLNRKHGTLIGYDVASGTYDPATKSTALEIAVTRKNGLLYLSFDLKGNPRVSHGLVTGGAGGFANATGTVTATTTGPDSSHVVLRYHF